MQLNKSNLKQNYIYNFKTPCCCLSLLRLPSVLYFTSYLEISAAQSDLKRCQILHSLHLRISVIHKRVHPEYPVCFNYIHSVRNAAQLGLTHTV